MLTYISLFSSAGVGCYGLKKLGYKCAATVELIPRRIEIQKHNKKCDSSEGYICGDITSSTVKERLYTQISQYLRANKQKELELLIATPPCQGISVANHKKTSQEIVRNSLVIESIEIIENVRPRFFILENVRGFLKAACLDSDGRSKSIGEALDKHLLKQYRFSSRVINFKDYGSNSSRTRTLVIGIRRDLKDCSPDLLFPDYAAPMNLGELIGDMERLGEMGAVAKDDYLHSFRPYKKNMLPWIAATKYGKSAFDNEADHLKPHQIKNGELVVNKSKNGDKYKRQKWEDVAPCVHTRSDCLPSQNTIHPEDNRVFSIRELMLMMTIPNDFKWVSDSEVPVDKKSFLKFHKAHDVNIRQCIGEAVPTAIFTQVGKKIKDLLETEVLSDPKTKEIISSHNLTCKKKLHDFIIQNPLKLGLTTLIRICELSNSNQQLHAAYYTRQDSCFDVLNELPTFTQKRIRVLEPSVGMGSFLYAIAAKYYDKEVSIDCIDIDSSTIETCKILADTYLPSNVKLNFIEDDFLVTEQLNPDGYDLVVGNPPYKDANKDDYSVYRSNYSNVKTKNLFSFFIERSMQISRHIAFIIPKSFLDSPQYIETRKQVEARFINSIVDFGESAFDVKIETIGLLISSAYRTNSHKTRIYSHRLNILFFQEQDYFTDNGFDSWLIYRNADFDRIKNKMSFGHFKSYRDRQITKSMLKSTGRYRVIKGKNIGNNKVIDTPTDMYIDNLDGLSVRKFLNERVLLVPNLTYNPRAAWLPHGAIPDGSAAVLIPNGKVTHKQIRYFSSDEFKNFYKIARNYSTRSMNIDSSSVKYFGLFKENSSSLVENESSTSVELAQ